MTRSLKYLGSATRRTAAGAALTALACSSVSGPEREGDGPLGLKYDITTETGMLLAIQDEAFLSQAMGNSSVRRTSAALTISNGPRHYGDVNGSGEVDIVDALLVAQYYVGEQVAPFDLSVAEVSGDGVVDIVDSLRIAQHYVGTLERFEAVDLSTLPYFPSIGSQTLGDCTAWSSAYYYNTFVQAFDNDWVAEGDGEVVNSVQFQFALYSEGTGVAECTRHAMEQLSAAGCATESRDGTWSGWPDEAAWTHALENRTGPLRSIQANTPEGIEAIKDVLASTHPLVTRADFGANYGSYLESASGYGIDNHVMYTREVDPDKYLSGHGNRHSMAIVGYNDNLQYTNASGPQSGAFLLANSEGSDTGWHNSTGWYDSNDEHRGFMWVAYEMFLNGEFGYYDWDQYLDEDEEIAHGPCFDNEEVPTVYYHEDRPRYSPSLYGVARVAYPRRAKIEVTGGIGSPGAAEFDGPVVVKPMDGGTAGIDGMVVVDLSDGAHLLVPGVPKQVFLKLAVRDEAGDSASITDVVFHFDLDGDGTLDEIDSTEDPVTVVPTGPDQEVVGTAGVTLTLAQ